MNAINTQSHAHYPVGLLRHGPGAQGAGDLVVGGGGDHVVSVCL